MDIYQTCFPRIRDEQLRERFQAAEPVVDDSCASYEAAGELLELHTIQSSAAVNEGVTSAEMTFLYEGGMVRKTSIGRPYYDRIKSCARDGLCPYCSQRPVSTLDHYLPKAHYAALAVFPLNLVPSCKDCNFNKRDMVYGSFEDLPFHPYFDGFDQERWLNARIVDSRPATALYLVDTEAFADVRNGPRAGNHLAVFQLESLYTIHAGREMRGISRQLSQLFAEGGNVAVGNHLLQLAEGWRAVSINSWQTALYFALAASDWYCNGGFRAGFPDENVEAPQRDD